MTSALKNFAKRLLSFTPYEIRRTFRKERLPLPTISPVEIALLFLLESGEPLNYVQIGAYDGSTGDPAHAFIRLGRMKSWLLEPVPSSFVKLEQCYAGVPNIVLINAAISQSEGSLTMYYVKPEGRFKGEKWIEQLASTNKANIAKHGVSEGEIAEIQVPSMTLASLMDQQGIQKIDVLQIDTEGYDAKIVAMALSLPVLPMCINFENMHLSASDVQVTYESLTTKGYRFINDGSNTLALLEKSFRAVLSPAA